eukprot:CAMPEP_0168718310 /NCGR_PEP_ID=MMETSP0724-20121128/450_1 /TAXON_ID=265536 /ORGANISM="Amphiprora sp., Strain CCMP467" /LENGTH=157 /DNA_ID=CAMNT_0008764815 /DNA_START=78 /DNA_END=551 /DNA_ORIENTATION=+
MTDSPISNRRFNTSMSRIEEDIAAESWCSISSKMSQPHVKVVVVDADDESDGSQGSSVNERPMVIKREESQELNEGILHEEHYCAPLVRKRLGSERSASHTSLSSFSEGSKSESTNDLDLSDVSDSYLLELGGIFDSLEIDHTKKANFRKEAGFGTE